ncbi:retrotransposon hot spot (RHS) protein, putative, partial [Trypanosoma vivax Y486]
MSKTGNASCRGQALRGDTADQKSQRSLKEVKPKPWTLESDVRDILLEGLTPPEDLMPSELGSTYDDTLMVVNNAPISEFFMNQQCHSDQPEQRQTAVNPDCHMYRLVEKDCALLNSIGVRDLGQWVEQDGLLKHGISTFTVSRLDAVWSLVKVELDSAAKLKARNDKTHREYARYTSVHRASWGYVESGHTDEPLGLKIFEGYPASVWTAEEVCVTPLLREIDNELPRPTGLEILVLSSKLGWPGTRFRHDASESGAGTHVYVNREMMRVWYLVEQGLDRWFEQKDGTANPWIVTCTPGSGRTHGLSSFLLRQLLNYRDGELVVVAFLTRTIAYLMYTEEYRYAGYVVSLFDQKEALLRIKETVSAQRRGYIVVDLCDEMSSLYRRLPVAHCGTLLLTGPEEKYYEEWSEYMNYGTAVMNCSDARDIKAFFAWETLRSLPAGWRLDEQQKADVIRKMEEGWDVVKERINLVGPLPCFVFDEDACRAHLARLVSAIPYTSDADAGHSIHLLQKDATWKSADTRRILLKLVRYRDADFEGDFHKCRLLSPLLRYAVAVLSLVRLERSNAKRCIALPPPVDRGDWIGT